MSAVLEQIEHTTAPTKEATRVPVCAFKGVALFQPWAVKAMSVIYLEQIRGVDEKSD